MKKQKVTAKISSFGKETANVPTPRPTPWVEKYRPKTIDDVAYQEEVKRTLKKSLDTGNLPHLLFYGPPGTGKTSTILAIGRELYGPELFKERVLELNASDERGISVIRSKVKSFAQIATGSAKHGKYPCPPYKLIVLDEADSMTRDAQAALRRVMERYSTVTRFCLICNYVSRIIDPVASRCAKFRFKPLEEETMKDRLTHITSTEGVDVDGEAITELLSAVDGDLRTAITILQTASVMHKREKIIKEHIIDILGVIPDEIISNLIHVAKSNSFSRVKDAVDSVMSDGYSTSAILKQLNNMLLEDEDISNSGRAKIAQSMAHADRCLIEGADETLQLLNVMCTFIKL